jgi:hypothetical protein
MKKSLTNRLYLKQRLYTLKMKEGMPLCDKLDKFNKIFMDLKNTDVQVDGVIWTPLDTRIPVKVKLFGLENVHLL